MFCWLIYKQLMRCTYRDLEGITGIDYTTFVKFKKRLSAQGWFGDIFAALSSIVSKHLGGISLILDSSFVETYSGNDEEGSGYSGYKEKNGFKLHQFIDYKSRLPLLQSISSGNVADICRRERVRQRVLRQFNYSKVGRKGGNTDSSGNLKWWTYGESNPGLVNANDA